MANTIPNTRQLMNKNKAGFTLIELLIAVSIASIVVTMALPSFKSMIERNRSVSQANSLLLGINLARSEAIRRSERVSLAKCQLNSAGTSCTVNTSKGYEQGWVVFADADNDGVFDSGETLIRTFDPMEGGATAVGSDSALGSDPIAHYISYVADGTARPSSGQFFPAGSKISLVSGDCNREISFGTSGRARVESGSC